MILSDLEIKECIANGDIGITPFNENQLESGNYRITLGSKLLIPIPGLRVSLNDIKTQELYKEFNLKKKPYTLKPNEFILGQTHEQIALKNNIAGILDGRSTFARLGVSIHQSSQFVTPGQDPHIITLEIYNAGPFEVELTYGVEFGKLIFHKFEKGNSRGYKDYGTYIGQKKTTGARTKSITN